MLRFDDQKWVGLQGGYRLPYDPRPALRRLENADDKAAWQELWENLHHQGDVDLASYAAVPHIADILTRRGGDWNGYALTATIEIARREKHNPPLPGWMDSDNRASFRNLAKVGLGQLATADEALATSILAVIALDRGLPALACMTLLEEDEREEMLSDAGLGLTA